MPSPETVRYLLLSLVGVVALCGALAVHASVRGKARCHVHGRGPLDDEAFAALFASPAEAEVAPTVRSLLKPYLPVSTDLVLPDDRLCADLGLAALDGLDANDFVADVERTTGVVIPDAAAQAMTTLRDIVAFVALAKSQPG